MNTHSQTAVRQRVDVQKPNLYAVIIHNDDTTTMEFVVDILVLIFNKSQPEAAGLMLDVHEKGQGQAGIYTYDIAETKKTQANKLAADNGFPLKLTLQEVPS
ncbi:MAG: ATP-dependent Clp protease adaptor ClpS [Defluviitaleaceae bacterium]|nr:ATP-dependent Clp protease adaptor ClpS [Defluviitaleaceae bacterium]